MTDVASPRAWGSGLARAYHQVADEPRIFTDPLAIPIVGLSPALLTVLGETGPPRQTWRYFMVGRVRFAEAEIEAAVAAGTRQVVVLGSGLDTFGCRNLNAELRVFEVDSPGTLAWKSRLLAQAGIDVPSTLIFTPNDLETGTLAESLASVDFDRTRPAIFVWLGCLAHLTKDAIVATLRFIAGLDARARVVLDYIEPPPNQTGPKRTAAGRSQVEAMAVLGDPWRTYLTADQMTDELRSLGFEGIEDLAATDLFSRYLEVPPPVDPDDVPRRLLRAGHVPGAIYQYERK